ncbi:MAG: MerR family transcriptional regulator [Oscillospiraceae bacterium]|nr:MerR family transcriptional regulator [Oscillospiraceae bacterium]
MAEHRSLLSISEMAYIHNITRTTLIYYDKIGLFRPEKVDENGYRYYSPTQMPLLREICFLRSIGISIDDIKEHNEQKNSSYTFNILYQQMEKVKNDIKELQERLVMIEQRVSIYQSAEEYAADDFKPTIEYLPERKAVFVPWDQDDINIQGLNKILHRAWDLLDQHKVLPCLQWGSILFQEDVEQDDYTRHAATYAIVKEEDPAKTDLSKMENFITIPAGYYACVCKYAMPYQREPAEKLIHWVQSQGYRITGDLIDACLLDVVFYEREDGVDFCQLQIPINYEEVNGEKE